MSIRIFNSMTRKKDDLVPHCKDKVTFYTCGPTVYDDPHIGHLRSAFVFEMIRKIISLEYKVLWVRNITDIDDKIIDRAARDGVQVEDITDLYIRRYHEALSALDIKSPDVEPRATDINNLEEMIKLIEKLIELNYAYVVGVNVYYRVRKLESYGRLSHQDIDQMRSNWRVEPGPGKEDPLDFALWKESSNEEPGWDSPWGRGRPGWHIECSAMCMKYCGESFDIHGGGKDLLFPHHENERAQSIAATGKSFASIWIHHGLVTSDGQKIAKSTGNSISLESVLSTYPKDALKLLFLQSHYSQDVDYTEEKMKAAQEAIQSFHAFFIHCGIEEADAIQQADMKVLGELNFYNFLMDDFNTPKGLSALFSALKRGNSLLANGNKDEARGIAEELCCGARLLGLFIGWSAIGITDIAKKILEKRKQLRQDKKFELSDKIRDALDQIGLRIEDKKTGEQVILGPIDSREEDLRRIHENFCQ